MVSRLQVWIAIALVALSCDTDKKVNASGSEIEIARIGKLKVNDIPLGEPRPGDWLYANPEKGQTLQQYKVLKRLAPDSIRSQIYLLPIGEFTTWQTSAVGATAEYLTIFFTIETRLLTGVSDTVISGKNRRYDGVNDQLLTTDILNHLRKTMPQDGFVIMAITSKDLYAGESYNFVFGQARAKHRVAVSSLFRYGNNVADSTAYRLLLQRLIKTSSHEIAHMLSCQHCVRAVCVMNGSNSLTESDSRPNRLCSECLSKLQLNLGFDTADRLRRLQHYFQQNKLEQDYGLAHKDSEIFNPAGQHQQRH